MCAILSTNELDGMLELARKDQNKFFRQHPGFAVNTGDMAMICEVDFAGRDWPDGHNHRTYSLESRDGSFHWFLVTGQGTHTARPLMSSEEWQELIADLQDAERTPIR